MEHRNLDVSFEVQLRIRDLYFSSHLPVAKIVKQLRAETGLRIRPFDVFRFTRHPLGAGEKKNCAAVFANRDPTSL